MTLAKFGLYLANFAKNFYTDNDHTIFCESFDVMYRQRVYRA